MVVQTMGQNQLTQAIEFDNFLTQQLSSAKQGFDSIQSQQQPIFFPQIFNLLTFPFRSDLEDFSTQLDNPPPASTVLLSQSERTNPTLNSQKSYLANAPIQVKPPSLIYQVKQGDTITKIASEHQVSSNELIKLNQIANSNVIFVDQKLQIPTTPTQNNNSLNSNSSAIASLAPTTNSRNLPLSKSNKTNIVPSADEDPYIANLRAEIDQLRAQYKQEQEQKVSGDVKAASLVSVTNQQLKPKAKSNPAPISTTKLNAKSNSASLQSNFESNLSKKNLVALKLPPLSNSEEYLPNAFDGYAWPAEGVMTSGYGLRWGRMHQGIDIAGPIGTPVLAAAAGKVIGAGWYDGYGYLIKVEHLDGSVTMYAHNNRIVVAHGQQVEKGEQIAEMGSTGNSTGSHLHFEIHLRGQEIVDPLTLLSKR
jgi:murein DD-endopeptidase MepM/ murein hydrolase activator NlpD